MKAARGLGNVYQPSYRDKRTGELKKVATWWIVYSVNGRRIATAEHSEYYTGDAKVILTGGKPRLVDEAGHSTEGEKLTYFSNDDRLSIDGAPNRPVQTFITRHRK